MVSCYWRARTTLASILGNSIRGLHQERSSLGPQEQRRASFLGRAYARARVLSDVRARHPGGSERRASSCSQEQGWKENRLPAPYMPRSDPFDLYRCSTRQEVFHDRNNLGRPCGADIHHVGEKQAPGLFGSCKGITAVIPSRPLATTGKSLLEANAAVARMRLQFGRLAAIGSFP